MKRDQSNSSLTARALPRTLFGYIWRCSGRHQVVLAGLSIVVFAAPTCCSVPRIDLDQPLAVAVG